MRLHHDVAYAKLAADLLVQQARNDQRAAWGETDAHLVPAGALDFRADVPDAGIHFVDAGHFALEPHAAEIGALMLDFLGRVLTLPRR